MKIEELVGSLQTYDLSLPPVKKLKTRALKASKKRVEVSSVDDSEDEEKVVAMLAKNFRRLMRNERLHLVYATSLLNDKATPSGRGSCYGNYVQTKCNRLDSRAALIWKRMKHVMESRLHRRPSRHSMLLFGRSMLPFESRLKKL
jgi:hypothetical protein